jgi:hypothetical protein
LPRLHTIQEREKFAFLSACKVKYKTKRITFYGQAQQRIAKRASA